MQTKKLPLYLENTFQSIYGNFGSRLAAVLLDGLILVPVTAITMVLNSMRMENYYYTFIVSQLLMLAYFLYLPVRYGASPGKRIMGLTILKSDGSPISYKESFLKYLPVLIMALFGFVIQCLCLARADADTFNSMRFTEQAQYLKSFNPIGFGLTLYVMYGYFLANLIIFLRSDRKQSIGDHLADTVSVHTRYLERLAEPEKPIVSEQE